MEHESMTLGCRRGMPRAESNRYLGMVTLEKMLLIALAVRWRRQMIPLSVKNMTYARSEVRGLCEGDTSCIFSPSPILGGSDCLLIQRDVKLT